MNSFQHVHVHILPRRPKDFKKKKLLKNLKLSVLSKIYDELNNHDKGPNVDLASGRRYEERNFRTASVFLPLCEMFFVLFVFNNALTVQKW